jgi:hypothetical protein
MSKDVFLTDKNRFIDPYDEKIVVTQIKCKDIDQETALIPVEYDLYQLDSCSIGFGGLSKEIALEFNRNYHIFDGTYRRFARSMRI